MSLFGYNMLNKYMKDNSVGSVLFVITVINKMNS